MTDVPGVEPPTGLVGGAGAANDGITVGGSIVNSIVILNRGRMDGVTNSRVPESAFVRALLIARSGLPREALQDALEPTSLATVLARAQGQVADDATVGGWITAEVLGATGEGSPSLDAVLVLFRSLTWWVSENPQHPRIHHALDSLEQLALMLQSEGHHEQLHDLFRRIERVVKFVGDKPMILRLSELVLQSINSAGVRSPQQIELAAQVKTCGHSWVLQRIGRLDEARAELVTALKQNQSVSCVIGEAFTLKCLGRLLRLEGERELEAGRDAEAAACFSKSLENLNLAIDSFARVGGWKEIGDCHSLIGRTHFVMGDLDAARISSTEAAKHLVDRNSKDFLDKMILDAELEIAAFRVRQTDARRERVRSLLDAVMAATTTEGVEISEIRARALMVRDSFVRLDKRQQPDDSLEQAMQIYRRLNDRDGLARCEWLAILNQKKMSKAAIAELGKAPVRARVAAVAEFERAYAHLGDVVAARSNASGEAMSTFVRKAIEDLAVQDAKDWGV